MIRIHNLSKRYGRRLALDGVSMDLLPGTVVLLLGANGAGKSTLLRCVLGITEYDGQIDVLGHDPLRDGRAVRSLVGYMPQTGGLHPDLTVEQTVCLYADIRRTPAARGFELLDEAGLGPHRTTKVGDLSGGMRQRLGFTLALLTDPPILVLDEPSASLDAASREWLARQLRMAASRGRIVLVSTHAGQELLDAGSQQIVLEDGRIVSRSATQQAGTALEAAPAASRGAISPIVEKEIKDAVANRWLLTYAGLLGVLGLAAAGTGIESSSGLALQAFGRTTATLMNLCLLLAPLVAVLMGASAIAGERERGTLEHLLAQPLTRTSLVLGKYVGLLAALTVATVAGFVPACLLLAWEAGPEMLGHYLLFPAIASLVGAAMLGIGVFVSVTSRSAVQSQGMAVFVWFGFVLLYDLILMGTLIVSSLPVEALGAALIANPVDAARVLGVLALEPDLYLLGPAGAYLAGSLSRAGAASVLLASLALWAVAPIAAAAATFSLRRPRRRAAISPGAGVATAVVPGSRPMSSTEVTLS